MEQNNRLPVFKEQLDKLRRQKGNLSNTEFAKILGISRQTLGFYLNGDRIPDCETLAQICKCCNVSADWLLGLSEDPNIESPTVDQLGLSPEAVKQLMDFSYSEQKDAIRSGLNLLIEDNGLLFLAADIAELCDKVKDAIDTNRQYREVHSPNGNDDYYKFVVARDYEIIKNVLDTEILSKYPKMKNDYSLIVGSRLIEYLKRSIVDRFDEIIRRLSNYQEYIDSTLQYKDIMK